MSTPTKEQVELFAKFLREWQDRLALGDWRVEPSRKKPLTNALADMHSEPEHRLASWRLGVDWKGVEITPEALESTAIHELLHVLLAELIDAAKNSATPTELLNSIEHGVIIVLERLLLQLNRRKGR